MSNEVKRYTGIDLSSRLAFELMPSEYVSASDYDALRAENEHIHGLMPEPPPRPPEGNGLPRYGLRWNGPSQPLSVPMDDGYWTPWHLANDLRAELQELRGWAVPKGYALVPVEQTDAMEISAGRDEGFCTCCGYDNGGGSPADIWRAMLAAAPKPESHCTCEFHDADTAACEQYSGQRPCSPAEKAQQAERQEPHESWLASPDDCPFPGGLPMDTAPQPAQDVSGLVEALESVQKKCLVGMDGSALQAFGTIAAIHRDLAEALAAYRAKEGVSHE